MEQHLDPEQLEQVEIYPVDIIHHHHHYYYFYYYYYYKLEPDEIYVD